MRARAWKEVAGGREDDGPAGKADQMQRGRKCALAAVFPLPFPARHSNLPTIAALLLAEKNICNFDVSFTALNILSPLYPLRRGKGTLFTRNDTRHRLEEHQQQ